MCGQYILDSTPEEIAEHFALPSPPKSLTPRFNIAPTQTVNVVALKADRMTRGMGFLKWVLVPYWSNDGKKSHINAHAETVGGLDAFADSFRQKRCIIPASGFYEWEVRGGKEISQRFRLASGSMMGFAGLWSVWQVEAGRIPD